MSVEIGSHQHKRRQLHFTIFSLSAICPALVHACSKGDGLFYPLRALHLNMTTNSNANRVLSYREKNVP